MKPKTILLFCLAIFLAIMAFDTYLYLDGVPGNSITQIVVSLSKNYPIVPAAIGFFLGGLFFHFFDTSKQ